MHCSSKVKKKKKLYYFVFILWLEYFILFFLSPPSPFLPIASLSPQSVLTLFISSRCPPLAADPSPCPAPIDLFVLRPYLSAISLIGFYVDGFYFYFDEWVLILLMVDEWWLGFSGWWMVVAVVVVVVVGVVVAVGDGRGGCGWCCRCFLGRGIYYFIVGDILFYCDIYIILLYWKLK